MSVKRRITKRKMANLFFSLCFGLALLLTQGITALADGVTATTGGASSTNLHKHEYVWYSATVPNSFLYENGSGYVRVEAISSNVVVENYSSAFALQSSKTIANELPIFGGFYNGANYNYLVYGQQNAEDSDEVEVMRVVKYDKNWNRLAALSYYGCNTYMPFDAGSMSFAEYGDVLYIRTCHEMYKSSDGYHHQACMTFSINQSTLSKIDQYTIVKNVTCGYVSHSFNQFIRVVGNKVVAVDHGDAYPRAVVLGTYASTADKGTLSTYGAYSNVNLLAIPGATGANYTGVNVGGFEVSSTHYLVAINSVDLDQLGTARVKNIKVLTQPIGDLASSSTATQVITSYAEDGTVSVSNPYLVPMENDQFALIWEETGRPTSQYYAGTYYNRVMIATLDHEGKQVGETKEVEGSLSDCQPIYSDGKLIWYVTSGAAPSFYTVSMKQEELKFDAVNLTLQDNLAINFKVKKSRFSDAGYGIPYVKFVMNGKEKTVTPNQEMISDETYYWFTCNNIAPQMIGDDIEATLYVEQSGTEIKGNSTTYSVEKYCYAQLNGSSSKTKLTTLIVDLLNYGTMAQKYTEYGMDHLVNAYLTTTQAGWGTSANRTYENALNTNSTTIDSPSVKFSGIGLALNETVAIRYKINVADLTGVTIKIEDEKGRSWTYGASDLEATAGGYYLYFRKLQAARMSDAVYATVYKNGTAVSNTIKYSIESYVSGSQSTSDVALLNLLNAMMKYGDAAKAYAN